MKLTPKLPEYFRSLARFPVSVATSLALTLLVNLQISGRFVLHDRLELRVIFAFVSAFLASLLVALWFSARSRPAFSRIAAGVIAATAAAILAFSHGDVTSQALVVVGGLILATMVSAHLRRGATLESFWFFNLQLGVAAAMGIVVLLIVCGGLSLLLGSCGYLFDLSIRGSAYGHIWATGAAMLAPLFALGMIPANFDQPFVAGAEPDSIEKAVFYVLNFALAPLVLMYALILHVYAIKIALAASMPKGEVGRLVLAFGVVGIVSYLVAYPWREIGLRPVRWLMRSWFWLMIIPTFLLALAVWQRIGAYGVTPERYCICLFALWMTGMIFYFAIARGRIDLRAIPASLAVLLLLSTFGPWSAPNVSIRSQLAQLQTLLERKHALVDGKLKLDPPRLETFARLVASTDQLSSILFQLNGLDALDRIAPMLASLEDNPRNARGQTLLTLLGAYGLKARSQDLAQYSAAVNSDESKDTIALNLDVGHYDKLVGPIKADGANRYFEPVDGLKLSIQNSVLTAGDGPAAVTFFLPGAIQSSMSSGKSVVLMPANEGRERAMLILVRTPQVAVRDKKEANDEVWLLLNTQASKFAPRPGHP